MGWWVRNLCVNCLLPNHNESLSAASFLPCWQLMPLSLLSPAAHVQSEPAFCCLVTFPDLLSPSPLLSQFLLLPRFAESRGPWTWAAISHWPAARKKASPGQHTSGRNWAMSPSCPQLPHKVLILLIILLFPRWQPGLPLVWAARGDMAHWASAIICMVPLLERRFLKPTMDGIPSRGHLNFHGFSGPETCSPLKNKDWVEWKRERVISWCKHVAGNFSCQPTYILNQMKDL